MSEGGQYFQYERESYIRSQSPTRSVELEPLKSPESRPFESRYSPSYNRQLENHSPSFQETTGVRSYNPQGNLNNQPYDERIKTSPLSSLQPQSSPTTSVESKFDQFLAATESRVKELREQANASIARIQSLSQRSASPTHSRPLDSPGHDVHRQSISSPRNFQPQTSPLSHPPIRSSSPVAGGYSPSGRSPSHIQQDQYRQTYSSQQIPQSPNKLSRHSPERNSSPNKYQNRTSPPAEQYEWLRQPSPLEARSSSPGPQSHSPSYSSQPPRQPSPQRYSPSQVQKYSYSTTIHETRQPSPEPVRPSLPLRPDTPPRSYPSDIPSIPPTVTNRSPSLVAGSSPSLRSRSPSGRPLDRPIVDNQRSPKTYSPTYGQAPTHSPSYAQPHSPSYSQPPRTQSPYRQQPQQQDLGNYGPTRSPRYAPQENRSLADSTYLPQQQQQQHQQQQHEQFGGPSSGYRSPIYNGGRTNSVPEYHEESERYHLIRGSPSTINNQSPHNLIPGNTSSPIYNAGSQLSSRANDIPFGGSPNSQRGIAALSQPHTQSADRATSSPSYFGGGSPVGSSRHLQSSPNTTPTSRYINPVRTDITSAVNLTPSQRSPLYNGGFQPTSTNRPLSDPYADLAAPPSSSYVPQLGKSYDNNAPNGAASELVEEYHLVRETVSYQ